MDDSSFIFLWGSYYVGIMMVKNFGVVFNYLCFLIAAIKFIIFFPSILWLLSEDRLVKGSTIVFLPRYKFFSPFPILANEFISIWREERTGGL